MSVHLPEVLLEGRHEPLGSFVRDGGVNFAVFSQHATGIDLCVFDSSGVRELKRYPLYGPYDSVFCGFVPNLGQGLVYGLRAHGCFAPENGHRFNTNKLLLDPYATEIVGKFVGKAENHGYVLGNPEGPRSFDARDNATYALKARVAPERAIKQRPPSPRIPVADLVLYEVHVKGFSKQHPDVQENLRGTYAGFAHPAAIAHFKALGVTTLSLLPVQYCVDEPALHDRGLRNYWGYNTLGFFCPDPRLAHATDPTAIVEEFKTMVDTLHANGLEVVLDVVYNHTPEGNEFGPTLSFRGLDNASYYRLQHDDKNHYENVTGCGNALNCEHPRVTQFVLDSLRYWVTEMGVDGFRFDLAPVLGRRARGFDPNAAFFVAMRQDPVLAGVHLIAEPWDAGHDGYQLGRFPGRFLEWNDKFRDAVRGFWLNAGVSRGEFARRCTASSDVFHHGQRRPSASINFIAVHDGYTLNDLVSYTQKHNHANGEQNRDGRDGEMAKNFGVEGVTSDPAINALRAKTRRAMVATLLLAQGTPMLCAGDEIGNTQDGNNNAYCQDNPTTWLDWDNADTQFLAFVKEVLAMRRAEPSLRYDRWFAPHQTGIGIERRLVWLTAAGKEMSVNDWHDAGQHAFACDIHALPAPVGHKTQANTADRGAKLMLLFNPEVCPQSFHVVGGETWRVGLDSSQELPRGLTLKSLNTVVVPACALVVLVAG